MPKQYNLFENNSTPKKTETTVLNDTNIIIKPPVLMRYDCLEAMKDISSETIDMVCCDLPYGITANKWDSVVCFSELWASYNRIVKKNGAIVLFASQPFTSNLIMGNIKGFNYQWVWIKSNATNFLNCYKMPMKKHEDICVFSPSKKLPIYYPQISDKPKKNIRKGFSEHNGSKCYGKFKSNSHLLSKIAVDKSVPTTVLYFNSVVNTVHPTQKPVDLVEYLIKTYTLEGETVLDNCMGSGTTGVACKNLNRNFIGIELDEKYFEIAKKRIEG